jgi:hypothetical protein
VPERLLTIGLRLRKTKLDNSFKIIMKTELIKTAKELGFIGQPKEMDDTHTRLFIIASMSEEEDLAAGLAEDPIFAVQILEKRIEVGQLPITFTASAKLASIAVTEGNPGRMVVLLIEALTKHEGETIDCNHIAELYPFGFYDETTFIDLVDNYIKPRLIKWSEIY